MRLGRPSWITTPLNSPMIHPGDTYIVSYSQELSGMLPSKGSSLCSHEAHQIELKYNPIAANKTQQIRNKTHNPIDVPPLNVEIYTVEKNYPNQKWNV